VCEVALSLVLLMGAGVMVQSLLALRHVDTGFDPNNVLTMRVRLVEARYPTPGQRSAFFEAALERIRALPGIEAAGTIDDLPFADGSSQTLALEGFAPQRNPSKPDRVDSEEVDGDQALRLRVKELTPRWTVTPTRWTRMYLA
jgi:putative ABC transport system permease protein